MRCKRRPQCESRSRQASYAFVENSGGTGGTLTLHDKSLPSLPTAGPAR
jgi:hypothetical protein